MRKTLALLLVASALVLACGLPLGAQEPQGFFVDVNNDLGEAVNTGALEGIPFTNDALTLFFSRWVGNGNEADICMATRETQDEPFRDGICPSVLNSTSFDAPGCLFEESNGRQTLFFYSARPASGHFSIYAATRANKDESFGDVRPLSEVNTDEASESAPSLTADGLMLLFCRYGSSGRQDIFVATRTAVDEPFGAPVRLEEFYPGSDVNTAEFDEYSPRLSTDGLTLFLSDVAGSPYRGGEFAFFDIWVSTRAGIDLPFGTPVSINNLGLGSQINTFLPEKEPCISPDWPAHGSFFYFAKGQSRDSLAGFDIWQATWVNCRATRTLSPGPYFPGDTLSVDLNVKKIPEGTLVVTETVPEGLTVTNTGGGTVSANIITFDFDDTDQVTYELTLPEDYGAFKTVGIGGAVSGDTDCSGEIVHGDSEFHTIGVGDVAPWTSLDIGETGFSGAARLEGEDLVVAAGGKDFRGSSDSFHFVYQEFTGDAVFMARISELSPADSVSAVGLMLRESLDAEGARQAGILLANSESTHHIDFERREGIFTVTSSSPDVPDRWLRLERRGNTFTGWHSENGLWRERLSVTIDMPERIYAGVAVTAINETGNEFVFARIRDLTLDSPSPARFIRADGNGDGRVNIADPSFIANAIFGLPVSAITCEAAVDANGDGRVNIADPTYVANFLFGISPATPPPAPHPDCGFVPAEETLGCLGTPGCLE